MSEKDYSGVRLAKNKGLNHWGDILEEWISCTSKYSNTVKYDASYWYNESANVGVLSAAIWQLGWVALTETQIMKRSDVKERYKGRLDLYVNRGRNREEFIEAKFRVLEMTGQIDDSERKLKFYKSSQLDAINSGFEYEVNTTAICFLLPYVNKSKVMSDGRIDGGQLFEMIEKFVSQADTKNHHLLAWCFPRETRILEDGHNNICPGIVLFGDNPYRVADYK